MEKETKHTPDKYEIQSDLSSYVNIFRNGTAWLGSVERTLALEICRKLNEHGELSEMKAAYEKDANKLMAERDRFKNLCDEKDKVIEDYSCNLKPVNELKAEIEKHMRELSEMKKENARLKSELLHRDVTVLPQKDFEFEEMKKEREELIEALEKLDSLIYQMDDEGNKVCFPMDMDFGTIRNVIESTLSRIKK